jgi:hypothetical protein
MPDMMEVFYEKNIEYLMDCFGDIIHRAERGYG